MTTWTGTMTRAWMSSISTGTDVEYATLTPPQWDRSERLPLVQHLHGAMSSIDSLERARAWYEREWARGELPRCVVVCASTPTIGGFYLDHPGGPGWSSLLLEELPDHLEADFGLDLDVRVVMGASMGGYGALALGLAHPELYRVIAALSPAIFPGGSMNDVPKVNRPGVLGDLFHAMAGGKGCEATYRENSVPGRLRDNLDAIRQHKPRILLDCGDCDEFRLHEGTECLHALLVELGIPHDYRLVAGAGHADAIAARRQSDAVRYIGEALHASGAAS